jgi:transcriptional regulator with XRE-family HTH domain
MIYVTGEQMRAARAMVRWEQEELARRANVSVKTIKRLEATSGPLDARSIWSIKNAFELGGVEFLYADDYRSRGEGVRFYKDRSAKLRRKLVDAASISLSVALELGVSKDQDLFERPTEQIVSIVLDAIREGLADTIVRTLRPENETSSEDGHPNSST